MSVEDNRASCRGLLEAPLEVFVYYDFASSLSYVAQRVLARIERQLAAERIELRWKAIDLTRIGRFRRGRLLDPGRRKSLIEVAAALGVELDPPARWPDSRLAGEVAVTLDLAVDRGLDPSVEREWRRGVFAAFHERGGRGDRPRTAPAGTQAPPRPERRGRGGEPDRLAGAAAELFGEFERRGHFGRRGLASVDDLAAGRRLRAATSGAAAAGVEGVPTLMFDAFPLCGIHDEATMLGMIRRYARRRRRLQAESTVEVN